MMRHAIVTGAAGFIGRAMMHRLCKDGWQATAVVRKPYAQLPGAVVGDLREPGVLDRHAGPGTVVFHLAGVSDGASSRRDPRGCFDGNTGVSFNMLETARATGCSLVLASSAAVYDGAARLPFREDGPLAPVSPYGAAKLASEVLARGHHAAFGVDVRIARLFSVYGPGMRRMAVHDFVDRLAVNRAVLTIRGDGAQVRDFIHVDDAASGLLAIAKHGRAGEAYNVASGKGMVMSEVAGMVAGAMDAPSCRIVPDGERLAGEMKAMVADTQKIKQLGFTPSIDFAAGLRETVSALARQHQEPNLV